MSHDHEYCYEDEENERSLTPYGDDGDDDFEDDDDFDDQFDIDFANPGSNSALRAASRSNPRNLPCPTCGEPNRLTPKDRKLGYQCDECADGLERGGW